jgi:hypothetical protein
MLVVHVQDKRAAARRLLFYRIISQRSSRVSWRRAVQRSSVWRNRAATNRPLPFAPFVLAAAHTRA